MLKVKFRCKNNYYFPLFVISQVSADLWDHASPSLLTCTYLDRPWTCLQASPHILHTEIFTVRLHPTPSSTQRGLCRAPGRTGTWNRKALRTRRGQRWSSLKNVFSCGEKTWKRRHQPLPSLNIGHVYFHISVLKYKSFTLKIMVHSIINIVLLKFGWWLS